MLVNPTLQEVVAGCRGMLRGIKACVDQQCLVSAVTLMFTSIDAISALTRPVNQPETDSETFRTWVDRFLHPESRLNCTAQDLWAARCGVLHTYSPEAPRAANRGARRIYYQWREGPPADAIRSLPEGSIVINIEDLHEAVTDAVIAYMDKGGTDADLEARQNSHLPHLLCYEPHDLLTAATRE